MFIFSIIQHNSCLEDTLFCSLVAFGSLLLPFGGQNWLAIQTCNARPGGRQAN